MLQVVAQAAARKVMERRIKKELTKLGKKNIQKELSSAFDKAFAEIRKTNPEITSVFDLEIAIKKDKKIRTRFFTLMGKELSKKGLRGDPAVLGKVGYKNIIRYKKTEAISAGLLGKEHVSEGMIMKLQNLFDSTAKHFGMDAFTFYYKYNTDSGFRKMANTYLMKQIQSDPTLSKLPLAKESPEAIMHSLANIKASFMTRRDVAKFMLKQLPKRAPIEFLKASAVSVGMAFQYMAMMPTMAVMQAVPQLSGMSFITMHGVQEYSRLYAQSIIGFNAMRDSSPHLYMKYASAEYLRRQMAEAERAGLIHA